VEHTTRIFTSTSHLLITGVALKTPVNECTWNVSTACSALKGSARFGRECGSRALLRRGGRLSSEQRLVPPRLSRTPFAGQSRSAAEIREWHTRSLGVHNSGRLRPQTFQSEPGQ
jgi:hypothetical protein